MLTSRISKVVALLVLTLLVIGAVSGCDKSKGNNGEGGLEGTVKVAGSTSIQPLAEELAEAFMDNNPDVNVSVQGGGSTAGVESANKGTAQIGTSSRELKDEEKDYGLTETVIAKDGIAVVINSSNNIQNLTIDQVKKIFTGEITDWSEVGGKKGNITVVVREAGSGTRGAFQEIVLGSDTKFISNAIVQNSTGAVKTAVTKDPNAIGFISTGSVDQEVNTIKIDNVAPSESTILDGSYKISRPFLFLTKGAADSAVQPFIDFILSDEGQKIVSEEFVRAK